MSSTKIVPEVSIGLPVYNEEKNIRKRINDLITQTFRNFELIISDNASTDSTSSICKEYARRDKRIRYIRQKHNISVYPNFYFILKKARSKYFVWVAADDIWEPTFLEKNIEVLNSDNSIVGSISKIEYYDKKVNGEKFLNFSYDGYPKGKSYYERAEFYLRFSTSENMYAVYRTDKLRKFIIRKEMRGIDDLIISDNASTDSTSSICKEMRGVDDLIILHVLKYGDINVLDEVLMRRSYYGASSRIVGLDRIKLNNDYGLLGITFPFIPFTLWCAKNIGIKFVLKNLDFFLSLNYDEERFLWNVLIISKIKNVVKRYLRR